MLFRAMLQIRTLTACVLPKDCFAIPEGSVILAVLASLGIRPGRKSPRDSFFGQTNRLSEDFVVVNVTVD